MGFRANQKTISMPHWKDHLNSTLLGAYSLFDDQTEGWKEVNGTILKCCHEDHILGGSGKKNIHVAHTSLGKPMKLNSTISTAIQMITGSKNPAKWVNVPVTFYVDPNVKFGRTTVEAIRVKPQKAIPKPDYSKQIACLTASKTLDELKDNYLSLTPVEQRDLAYKKDELKDKLV